MDPRYLKNIPALSAEEQELLGTKKIFIAGCGGLGGYLLEFAERLGIGEITAADGDSFASSNLNRQLLADSGNIGQAKTQAALLRCRKVNPDVRLSVIPEFIVPGNAAAGLIKGCDAVLDGLDSAEDRRFMVSACREENIPYIYGSISGWTAQTALIMPGDRHLDYIYGQGKAVASDGALSFTPAMCAAMELSICVRLLCGRNIRSGELFCFDLQNMEFHRLQLD